MPSWFIDLFFNLEILGQIQSVPSWQYAESDIQLEICFGAITQAAECYRQKHLGL